MFKGTVQEKRFEYKGYPCVILMHAIGFRTGYVGIPKGHKYYKVGYEKLMDISCHGSLTYSAKSLTDQTDTDIWWIGFDCGHYGDGYDYDTAIKLFKDYSETIENIKTIAAIRQKFNDGFEAKSLEYCIEECKEIVDQICEV